MSIEGGTEEDFGGKIDTVIYVCVCVCVCVCLCVCVTYADFTLTISF